jgi:hypothetical protein
LAAEFCSLTPCSLTPLRRDPCSEAINGTIDPLAVPVKGMGIEHRCAWKYCELILIA